MKRHDLAVASDGSPVLVYLRLPGNGDARLIHAAIPPGACILELGCGPGRVTRPLIELGHLVTGVDNSGDMLAYLTGLEDAETVLADIATLDLLPRRWPVVLMASHLINDERGSDFLDAAVRHVDPDGCVLIERYQPGWVDTVRPSRRRLHGVTAEIGDIHRPDSGTLKATMVYEVEGHRFEQPFTAHEVDDDRLADLAASRQFGIDTFIGERRIWVRVRRLPQWSAP